MVLRGILNWFQPICRVTFLQGKQLLKGRKKRKQDRQLAQPFALKPKRLRHKTQGKPTGLSFYSVSFWVLSMQPDEIVFFFPFLFQKSL